MVLRIQGEVARLGHHITHPTAVPDLATRGLLRTRILGSIVNEYGNTA